MKNKIIKYGILSLLIIIILFIVSNYVNIFGNISKKFYTNKDVFENIVGKIIEYPEESLYIDEKNLVDIEKVFLEKYNITFPIKEIEKIFNIGFRSISKRGSSIFFYKGNFIKNSIGSKAYGIVFFNYYFSTNEPNYELVTAIRALEEKSHNWYYYEER